jgi:hypothetical protein
VGAIFRLIHGTHKVAEIWKTNLVRGRIYEILEPVYFVPHITELD